MKDLINKVTQGDCLQVMKQMPDNSVDLVLTDPPYFNTRGDFDFVWQDFEDYFSWCKKWIIESDRVLKINGSMYIYGWYEILIHYHLFLEKETGMTFRSFITWNFKNGNRTNNNWSKVCEYIIYFTKSDEFTFNMDSIRTQNWSHGKWQKGCNPSGLCATNYFDENKVVHNSSERMEHPTQKPIEQIAKIIKASSNENDIILDPFLGSGTTAVACQQLKRNFIGIEISQDYVNIAKQRLAQKTLF